MQMIDKILIFGDFTNSDNIVSTRTILISPKLE